MAVEEGLELIVAAIKGPIHAFRRQRRGQWHVTAGQALAHGHQVRFDAFVLAREHRAGTAKPRRDLVSDQQRVVLCAEPAKLCEIAPRLNQHAAGSQEQGFNNHRSDLSMMALENVCDGIRTGNPAAGKAQS